MTQFASSQVSEQVCFYNFYPHNYFSLQNVKANLTLKIDVCTKHQYQGNSSSNFTIRRTRLTFCAPRKRTKIILFPTHHHVVCWKTKGEEPFCGNFKIKFSYNMRQLNMKDLNFDDSDQFPNTAMTVLFTCVRLR